jgi:hypothetical protein
MALRPDTAERNRQRAKHGLSSSGEYFVWSAMVGRCHRAADAAYADYGARGITVCERWRTFANFHADMGSRPSGMSLERRDNSKGYEPGNCYWATRIEQNNNRRNNHRLTAFGKTQTLAQWSRELRMHESTIRRRLARGLPVEQTLSQPSQGA